GFLWADRGVRLEEAVKLLRRAIALEPHSGAILDSLGWAYHRLGKNDEAQRFLLPAMRPRGQNAEIARPPRGRYASEGQKDLAEQLGDVYASKGKKDAAKGAYERSLAAIERMKRARDPDADKNRTRVEKKRTELARKK